MRHRQQDAGRCCEHGSDASGFQKEAAHLWRLSQNDCRARSRHRADCAARSLARAHYDRSGQSRHRYLGAKADQRGCPRRAGDGRSRPRSRPCRAGWFAAPQHPSHCRSARPFHPGREARQNRTGGNLLLLPHARHGKSARHRTAAQPRLRNVDGARPHASVQFAGCIRAVGEPSWSTATAS